MFNPVGKRRLCYEWRQEQVWVANSTGTILYDAGPAPGRMCEPFKFSRTVWPVKSIRSSLSKDHPRERTSRQNETELEPINVLTKFNGLTPCVEQKDVKSTGSCSGHSLGISRCPASPVDRM